MNEDMIPDTLTDRIFYQEPGIVLLHGDCRDILPLLEPQKIQCCITSPPYWGLRDYGISEQIGLEKTPDEYTGVMVLIFDLIRRAMKSDGTLWLNLGDSYSLSSNTKQSYRRDKNPCVIPSRPVPSGLKPKDLVGIPWRIAFALQAAGWYLRSDIIWHKPNPMPESVLDRPTKAHEYIFLMTISGNTLLWRHSETMEWIYECPEPDYRWTNNLTSEVVSIEPDNWQDEIYYKEDDTSKEKPLKLWTRKNLWTGYDYFYNSDAIRELWVQRKNDIKRAIEKHPGYDGKHGQGYHRTTGNRTSNETAKGQPVGDPEKGRNKRSVWTVSTKPYAGAHFAVFPPELIEPCILAGTREGDIVIDPFSGSGTVGHVCKKYKRRYIGIEVNREYLELSPDRIGRQGILF